MPLITHIVTDKHTGKRLDIFIAHYEPHISRSRIQSLIKDGLALVNGKIVKTGYKVKPGEQVTLDLPERKVRDVLPEAIPLTVIYEDAHMIVLNKPPGLTFVLIQEVEMEDWGVGGVPVAEYRRQSGDRAPG